MHDPRGPYQSLRMTKNPSQADTFPPAFLKMVIIMFWQPQILAQLQSAASSNLIHIHGGYEVNL